jgi:rubredoxin
VTSEGRKCPQCGAEGKGQTEHETAVHNIRLNRISVVDVGWRCWNCGHESGFAYSSKKVGM